ncbi:MAG: GIY-YIG nuclease family protein [Ignavibacteria bacterium]
MIFTVYILKSLKDGKRYIGYTKNLHRRLYEHNSGGCKSTRNRRPLEIVYHEEYDSKSEAMMRERFFKSSKGRIFLRSTVQV